MPEYLKVISDQLVDFLVTLSHMKKNGSAQNSIKAFYEMGCHFYGKDNIVEYADGIGELGVLKGLI